MGRLDVVGDTDVAHLALRFQLAQQGQLGAGVLQVVHLHQVQLVGPQGAQAGLDLGHATLTAGGGNLRREKGLALGAGAFEQFAGDLLRGTVTGCGIDQRGAAVDKGAHHLVQGLEAGLLEAHIEGARGAQADYREHLAAAGDGALLQLAGVG
ncbi:hypothetical protein D9M68_774910 [compost metagenome]